MYLKQNKRVCYGLLDLFEKSRWLLLVAAIATALLALIPTSSLAANDKYDNPKQAFSWYSKGQGCMHFSIIIATPKNNNPDRAMTQGKFSVVDDNGVKTECFYVGQVARQDAYTTCDFKNYLSNESELFVTNDHGFSHHRWVGATYDKMWVSKAADNYYIAEMDWYYPVRFSGKKFKFRVDGELWLTGGSHISYNQEIGTIDFEGINFETYDVVPGTEAGEEGLVKVPFSCDRTVNWIEASYTDEDGNVKNLGRTTFEKNSYSGFLKLPAIETHRHLQMTANVTSASWTDNPAGYDYPSQLAGNITKTITNDGVLHNARFLRADMMTDISTIATPGSVLLQWRTKDNKITDVLLGDQFVVQRSLTGKLEDYVDVGYETFDENDSIYHFKDSTLISSLKAEHIDTKLGIPLGRYRVYRGATGELWGMDKNPIVAYAQPQMATLALLQPTNGKAVWSNETERKVKVTWDYLPSDDHYNYVWDARAAMKIEVLTFRSDGSRADSTVTTLTSEQIQKHEMELSLSRSCVKYQMRLLVDGANSPIGKGASNIFYTINSFRDWANLAYSVNEGNAYSNVIMLADFGTELHKYHGTTWNIGYWENLPFGGNFNGNGHTITLDFDKSGVRHAPFVYLTGGAVIANLHIKGTMKTDQKFAGGIASQIQDGKLFIENCHSSVTIFSDFVGDGSHGGLVGIVANSGSLFISNSLFDGKMESNTGEYHQTVYYGTHCGGMVGFSEKQNFTLLTNNYVNGNFDKMSSDGSATFVRRRDGDVLKIAVQDGLYKKAFGAVQGKQSNTAPDNWCWEDGKPKVRMILFGTPVSGSKTSIELPEDQFYYENLGKIDKKSIKAEPQQSSVVLTWNNVDDTPVDYYEVWRQDTKKTNFDCIASQLTEMFYEDKTTSPVHQYNYFVRGVNNCEGTKYEDTDTILSHCVQTGMVEGYLRFADGTGIPAVDINITSEDHSVSEVATTDESGYFRKSGLPYFNDTETTYSAAPGLNGYSGTIPVTFKTEAGGNKVSNVIFVVEKSVKFSGYVQYDGTSIPVQGVSFLVDGREVHTSSGKVLTDHEGKYSFRMLEGEHSIQAVKDGHVFYQDGYFHEDNNLEKKKYYFGVDKADIRFYDETRVKLIGRVAGGKDQGAIPLGNSLSKNNLGDDLQMVLMLEGDNSSRLVWDIQDRNKKERDEEFIHQAHD